MISRHLHARDSRRSPQVPLIVLHCYTSPFTHIGVQGGGGAASSLHFAPDDALMVGCRCNGLSYTMNYVDEAPKLDEVINASDGILPFPPPVP